MFVHIICTNVYIQTEEEAQGVTFYKYKDDLPTKQPVILCH